MRYSTTIGVDLAKNVIQVSVLSSRRKELCNRSLTRKKFAEFLGKQKPSLVAFESCATAHYWARTAVRHGYEARIIKVGNSRLRSVLILGARAYTYRLKEPKSSKDRWLKAITDRNGHSRAAIALANKNVRTAWAMVTQGTEYQRRPQLKVAA